MEPLGTGISFVSSSAGKMKEALLFCPGLTQLKIDLAEIQSLDAREVIEAKLVAAEKHGAGSVLVEDTSLTFSALGRLPGTLIKFFEQEMGNLGLAKLAAKLGDCNAGARTLLGFCDNKRQQHFFSGELAGTIVFPRGVGFGWDAIFQPSGYDKTFAELGVEEKGRISMRSRAFEGFKQHIIKTTSISIS